MKYEWSFQQERFFWVVVKQSLLLDVWISYFPSHCSVIPLLTASLIHPPRLAIRSGFLYFFTDECRKAFDTDDSFSFHVSLQTWNIKTLNGFNKEEECTLQCCGLSTFSVFHWMCISWTKFICVWLCFLFDTGSTVVQDSLELTMLPGLDLYPNLLKTGIKNSTVLW